MSTNKSVKKVSTKKVAEEKIPEQKIEQEVAESIPEQKQENTEPSIPTEKQPSSGMSWLALWIGVGVFGIILLLNQYQIMAISGYAVGGSPLGFSLSGSGDLENVDVTQIESTAQGIALLFPLDKVKTTEDAVAIMIPQGTPDYGDAMGISYDEPLDALNALEKAYPALKKQAQQNPEAWQRYLSLAAAPRGVACEFCCGVGEGVDSKGELRCGCSHNPAVQALTLWLVMNTDYSDAEILREVYYWKSIWFPKNMVGLAMKIAGGDSSVLKDLPGMVGGC